MPLCVAALRMMQLHAWDSCPRCRPALQTNKPHQVGDVKPRRAVEAACAVALGVQLQTRHLGGRKHMRAVVRVSGPCTGLPGRLAERTRRGGKRNADRPHSMFIQLTTSRCFIVAILTVNHRGPSQPLDHVFGRQLQLTAWTDHSLAEISS